MGGGVEELFRRTRLISPAAAGGPVIIPAGGKVTEVILLQDVSGGYLVCPSHSLRCWEGTLCNVDRLV